MGKFAPVALAFALNSNGVYVFREPMGNMGCESPFLPGFLFLFSTFLLLWEMDLYPCGLRRLWCSGAYGLDFFMSLFAMEHLVSDFWGPLEIAAQTFIPRVADAMIEALTAMGFGCSVVVDLLDSLRCDSSSGFVSYLLSIFFFCVVIHATRIVDFRLLQCGFGVFIQDPIKRAKKFKRKLFCMLGMKSKVDFCSRPRCPRPRPRPCYNEYFDYDCPCDDCSDEQS